MSLAVNHNMMAANVARNLNAHYGHLSASTRRLSTGLRINSAADDAAGLAISELQRADIAALKQGARNANDAISLIQVADGSLSVIDEKLIRMRELAEQAATGTYSSTQRLMIESEYQQMASEISRIANSTDFNGIKLLDGTLSGTHDGSNMVSKGALKVHFGTGNDSAEDYYYITIGNCTAEALGVGSNAFEWKPFGMTKEDYEKLRDESAQKVYDKTYTQKYDAYYKEIYANLTTGTAATAGVGLPADVASAQAEEEARARAEEEATQDANMFKATADKVYEDSYSPAYRDAYFAAIAEGKSRDEADKIANKAGEESAIKAVRTTFESATGGITSLLDYVETSAKEAIYNDLYARIQPTALTNAVAANGNVDLNTAQQQELESKLKAALEEQAAKFAEQTRLELEMVYNNAEAQTKGSGMKAVHEALTAASNDGRPFLGNNPTVGVNGLVLQNYQAITIPAFTLQNANGTPGMIAVGALNNNAAAPGGTPGAPDAATITGLYQTVGGKAEGTEYWPPRNREGADLLIDQIRQEGYDAVYDFVYNTQFNDAVAKVKANIAPATTLTADQVLAIHRAADADAKIQAELLASKVEFGLQLHYSTAYEGNPAGRPPTGFNAYYNQYLDDGYPQKVAQHMAEKKASEDGWNAMKAALDAAQANGTAFWANPTGTDFYIEDADMTTTALTITVPGLTNGQTGITTDAHTGAAADVQAIYTAVGTGGNAFLDNHGLLGETENTIDGALHYMDAGDWEEGWVPTKGNNLLTQENAQHAITAINSAIETKDKIRAHLGALQNRFENTITNLNIQAENLQNAESRISDVDVATEMTEFVRQQILTQTAVAMLAQANSLPQMASQLIGG